MGNTELAQCLTVCGHISLTKAIQREHLIIMDTSALICFMEIDCIKKKPTSCRCSSTGIAPLSHPHYFQVLCPSQPGERETVVLGIPTGTEVLLKL